MHALTRGERLRAMECVACWRERGAGRAPCVRCGQWRTDPTGSALCRGCLASTEAVRTATGEQVARDGPCRRWNGRTYVQPVSSHSLIPLRREADAVASGAEAG